MQPTTSAGALSQLESTESSAQDPNAILASQQQALGVNGAQSTVSGLQGAINSTTKLLQQVAPSVMGRTSGSLVTSAQANKQVANEQAPINTDLTNETNQYNQANTNLTNLQNQAQTAASGIYQGQQDKESYLQNLYSSLYGQEQDAANLAETEREANLKASSSTSDGLDIGDILAAFGKSNGTNGYATTKDSSGGTQFTLNGNPITAAQYFDDQGGTLNDVAGFLKTDPNSQAAYKDLESNKYSQTQLEKMYPYIFGTS